MGNGSPDYTRRVILYAYDGTNFIPVLVDESGNIVGVFKGKYAETLKTIKVDSEGRMIALLTDPQDVWGNFLSIGTGELAARLGSPKTYDRRGEVLSIDGFEHGLGGWAVSGTGSASDVVLSSNYVKAGGYSAKLTAGVTDLDNIQLLKSVQPLTLGKIGFEVSFSKNIYDSGFSLYIYNCVGTTYYRGSIRYDSKLNDLFYYSSEDKYIAFDTDTKLFENLHCFHTIKLVVDFKTNKYVRALVNEREHNLSEHFLATTGNADIRCLEFYIVLHRIGVGTATSYVDDVIITQNEPENVQI